MRRVTFRDVNWEVEDIIIPAIPEWSFWDHWELGEFEPDTLDAVDRFAKPGATFLDIGAWVGNVSLWAARQYAHVVAVEPDPAAAAVLRRNTEANYTNITVFEGAINAHTGTCYIAPHSDGWGSSMTRVADEGTEVPCLTFPDLFDLYDIEDCSLVKMDCEGSEGAILEHAAPFLANLGIPLLVAMHEDWWPRPVEPSWFDGFATVEGIIGGWNQVLALP